MFTHKLVPVVLVSALIGISWESITLSQTPSSTTSPQSTRASLNATDREFIPLFTQSGLAEISFGQLAQQRATTSAVKQYAQQMINQHTQVNNQFAALATQKGVTPPKTIGANNQAIYNRLSQRSGKSFDQAYINLAGIQAHIQTEALLRREIRQGQDPDVKTFAQKTLPAVQEHLQMARNLTR